MKPARAWATVVALALALAALLVPRAAHAFHAGNVFDKPPGAGGGGGLFYAGIPTERGWTCTMCHQEPAGQIRIQIESDPPELFQSLRFEPGVTYAITLTLVGEHVGQQATRANYNGFVAVFVDADGYQTGTVSGPGDLYTSGSALITTAGQEPNQTEWSFFWTPTPSSPGAVTLHLAMVDGNGAGKGGDETLTDPFGDDVVMAEIALEVGGTTAAAVPDTRDGSGSQPGVGQTLQEVVGLLAARAGQIVRRGPKAGPS